MSGYSDFAAVYDSLMWNADYEKRVKYIEKLFKKFCYFFFNVLSSLFSINYLHSV